MFKNFFKTRKYLDCPYMKYSLNFFYDRIISCLTYETGPCFYMNYKGDKIDWNYVYKLRTDYVKKINSPFNKNRIPSCCIDCSERKNFMTDKKVNGFENQIKRLYFHNNMSCNAKCIYCTYSYIENGYKYKVLPIVQDLIEKEILSRSAMIYMSGGEITISPEFEDLLSILSSYVYSQIEILTSGIKYCKSIENAFIQNKCKLVISLDSSSSETYKKIKQVDCFDKVVNNLKNYINVSDYAKTGITLKYILVDGINDNLKELSNFVHLVKHLEIKNIRLDFDYEKYKFASDKKVPEYYFDLYNEFNKLAAEAGLNIEKCQQIEAILNKSR